MLHILIKNKTKSSEIFITHTMQEYRDLGRELVSYPDPCLMEKGTGHLAVGRADIHTRMYAQLIINHTMIFTNHRIRFTVGNGYE